METRLFTDDGEKDFVAVKTLKPPRADTLATAHETAEREFLAEIELMKQLRHPNLVKLLGVCVEVRPFYMVLEFLKGGSLEDWLPENGAKMSAERLTHMLHQVALGFVALGNANIVHRDLASRNVLIDEHLHIKVADYGR